jgi:hypothetical protein
MDRACTSQAAGVAGLELPLQLPDGTPWPLRLSPGMQRFIGYYIRVEGIDCGGPLLAYRRVTIPAPDLLPPRDPAPKRSRQTPA